MISPLRIGLFIAFATAVVPGIACRFGEPTEAPSARGGPVAMRRLTADQYRQAIADSFGTGIEIVGRFEPDHRREGLIAIGSAWVTVTPSGFEQYEAMGNHVARQVVSEPNRERFVPCAPRSVSEPDAACVEAFIREIGPGLLRRPLVDADIEPRIEAAARVTELMGDFYAGLELVATSLLVAPDFLFRMEMAEPSPTSPDRLDLSGLTLATRLSYLLWNAGPDAALLEAAAHGELSSDEGLLREVDRMLASPRVEAGVRAFFEDVFRFGAFGDLGKDPIRYPIFSSELARDAREQTLRVVVDHLITKRGDYRDLFTTRRSFLTRRLGPIYAVPVAAEQGWEEMEFPVGDSHAGLLSHASFNMLNAHPGRSSATLRGVFLREALLCQSVPPAPADVDFGLFVEDDDAKYKTARDRLGAHASSETCRKCHELTDPIGLGLEIFDGVGRVRATENGAPIDTSGELDGEYFANSVELGEVFRESPLVGACLVENLYRYAVGREPLNSERRLIRYLEAKLEYSDYRLEAILREIVMSDGFRTASRPQEHPLATESLSVAPFEVGAPTAAPSLESEST
ncbi:MAG: hypothetical protein CL933_07675 [Deltaproteobacteria bacterium]|nr:hypothetical protein [Deltaproteobacteria bacterium]